MTAFSESSRLRLVCLALVFCASGPHKDFAVEYAVRAARQDAVIKLVAFAMRLGVIHHGVMIDQLFAPPQEKPVQNRLRPSAVEPRLNLVARQPRPGGDGMGEPMAVPPLHRLHRRDVKGALVLVLQPAMFQRAPPRRATSSVTALVRCAAPVRLA